jgi:beta-glucosidase
MPTYDILDGLELEGKPVELVGAGFNAQLLTGALRATYKYRGLVLSDWAITNDCDAACMTGTPPMQPQDIAMPWGVESLTKTERFAKGMDAGIDQFGGVDDGASFVDAVNTGLLPIARLDAAVARILALKFQLGLFENPFVDEARAAAVVGAPANQREASRAQSRSLVVLENARGAKMLPKIGATLFLHGVDSTVAVARGYRVVGDAAKADLAILRIAAPFQTLHPTFFFGRMQHEGDLDFKPSDTTLALVRATAAKTKTIVVVYLDRPAILTAIKPFATTLIGEFGISDGALFDALSGAVPPVGRLPFELPSSMAAVQAQASDLPHDSAQPLYPIGYRLGGTSPK